MDKNSCSLLENFSLLARVNLRFFLLNWKCWRKMKGRIVKQMLSKYM